MLVQKATYQLGTTHKEQGDIAPTFFDQGFPGSWQFWFEGCRPSDHGSKHSLSSTTCFNHTMINKYFTITELYLTFSKYGDKLLVVKSLINILKFTHLNIVFYSFFSHIFLI